MKMLTYTSEDKSVVVFNPKNLTQTDTATIGGKVLTLTTEIEVQRQMQKGDLYLRRGRMSEKVNIAQRQVIQGFESAIKKGTIVVPPEGTPEHDRFQKLVNNTIVKDAAILANKIGELVVIDTW